MNSASSLYEQEFTPWQMAAAALVIVLAMLVSRRFKLNLEKDFFIASIRTAVQLIFVGYLLRWIFHSDSLPVNILILSVMSLAAAQAVLSRVKKKSWKVFLAGFFTLVLCVWPVGFLSVTFLFGLTAIQQTSFFIPFFGVLLGNCLSAVSLSFLSLERIRSENLLEIETLKSLGASPFEACQRLYNETLRSSMTPILNGMTIVGLVSLPGVMAGQLIGGVDPLMAARFQIIIMFFMAFCSLLGSVVAVFINHYYFMPSWLLSTLLPRHFRFDDGARVFVSGPSGVGKSRLLKSLVQLDIAEVQEKIKMAESLQLSEPAADTVLYLSQKPYFLPGTVEENLKKPFSFKNNLQKKYDGAYVEACLLSLGLETEILQSSALTLSGGEGQIVHLIRALQLKPQVVFLDEVTAALDLPKILRVEEFLTKWAQEKKGRHLMMISHNPEQIARFSTQVLRLEKGSLVPLT